jgi:hypothetical protein
MSIALLVFPDRSPDKPREGAECNGCGRCCAAEPCSIAREFLNEVQRRRREPAGAGVWEYRLVVNAEK